MSNEVGRPTKYKEKFNKQVYKLCLLDATDKEIADFFEVSESTYYKWQTEYPQFSEAIKKGKIKADSKIASSAFKKAHGFHYTEKKTIYDLVTDEDGEEKEVITGRVETTKYVPPDTGAFAFWLKNRRKQQWRDKHDYSISGEYKIIGPGHGKKEG